MRVLLACSSRHGATDEIADRIAAVLDKRGLDVARSAPQSVRSLDGIDAVVLGSAVYIGRWLEPARGFVTRFADELANRDVWLFSSGPIGDPPKPDELPVDAVALAEATGARDHQVFAGRVERRRLGMAERAVMRALKVADRDDRDWDAIRDWANSIADALADRPAR
ncbi:MAG: flavodoxin domain-containing protein [Nitriliruptoraceae bacterium]